MNMLKQGLANSACCIKLPLTTFKSLLNWVLGKMVGGQNGLPKTGRRGKGSFR